MFSLSVAIGKVLYDTRFGCFGVNPSVEGRDFAHAVKIMFQTTEEVMALPGTLAKVLFRKTWGKHRDATALLFKMGMKYFSATTHVDLSVRVSYDCLSTAPSICMPICLSVYLPTCIRFVCVWSYL